MSVKKAFLVKVHSGVLDYGHEFSLVQFHYDRVILAKFCARDRFANLPLRWALADLPEAGVYFKERRAAMLDLPGMDQGRSKSPWPRACAPF